MQRNGDGAEALLANAHQYEGYNMYMVLQPTMAADGAVWQLVDVAALEPSGGQYYFEVTPAGRTKVYKLVIPKLCGRPCRKARGSHPVMTG